MNPAAGCTNCALCADRQSVVWGEGSGATPLFIIGEAPGRFEDIEGRPFVGASGRLLTKVLGQVGLDRADVYITNRVKCRPPNNRDPLPREYEACQDWLEYELSTVKPQVVLLLGRTAATLAFPGEKKLPAGQARQTTIAGYGPVTVVCTYHPAAALRDHTGTLESYILRDLKRAVRYAGSG